MKTVIEIDIKNGGSVYPMPTDRDGYLHLHGLDKLLLEILTKRNNDLGYEILDTLQSTCILLNAINLLRKTPVTWEQALAYTKDWAEVIPWRDREENFPFIDSAICYKFQNEDFDPLFLKALARSQLQERDEALKKLYKKIISVWKSNISWYQQGNRKETYFHQELPVEFNLLFPYLHHAFQNLVEHWDKRSLQFVAPIFRTRVYSEKTYESFDINYLTPLQYTPSFELREIYHEETKEIIGGYYDEEGNFQVSEFLDFDRKCLKLAAKEKQEKLDAENDELWDDLFGDSEVQFGVSDELFEDSDELFGDNDELFGDSNVLFEDNDELFEDSDELLGDCDELFDLFPNNKEEETTMTQHNHNTESPFGLKNKLFEEEDDTKELMEMLENYDDEFFEFYLKHQGGKKKKETTFPNESLADVLDVYEEYDEELEEETIFLTNTTR